jgi:transcription antitermination factor NusG
VARVKPRHEKALAHDLARIGVGYYLPMMGKRTIRRDNNKPRKSVVCLFPGYISLAGYEEHKPAILRTGRVIRVIPVINQEQFVAELDQVKRALDSAAQVGPHSGLMRGQRVMIVAGPLQGLEGIVADTGRTNVIYLNVEMFSRAVSIKVSPSEVEAL